MNKRVVISLVTSIVTILNAADVPKENIRIDSVRKVIDGFGKMEDKEVSEVDKIKKMFKEGKASGQLKIIYAGAAEPGDAYATAIGGILKYELAEYRGFNAAAAVYTSYDIPFASGSELKRNTELSSSVGNHTEMSEAYINYQYDALNFRAGRQVLDTPLADSDDIRMIQNSFEAYTATYNFNDIEFIAGNIQRWHGVDAGLDDGWSKAGEKGTNFGGVSYAKGLEFDVYYYNITNLTNAAYFDLGIEYQLNDDILLHAMTQYLYESELSNSGTAATIYGALAEVVLYDIGFNLAINKAKKYTGKESFSGFGGGALFTSMDTMIIDEIAKDREALAYVLGVSYKYNDFSFLYAYGNFSGKADSSGVKAHIVEENIGAGYSFNEEFIVGTLYAIQKDKYDASNNWHRLQLALNYNF
jgi:hypothetical protein